MEVGRWWIYMDKNKACLFQGKKKRELEILVTESGRWHSSSFIRMAVEVGMYTRLGKQMWRKITE